MVPDLFDVVVVDDAADVRAIVTKQLTLSRRFRIVAEGRTGREALELAAQHRPDILVLDASMPDMDGLSAIPGVLAASPATKIVMLSGFDAANLAEQAIVRGAAAYVEKSAPLRQLPARLLEVLEVENAPLDQIEDHSLDAEAERVLAEHLERFRTVFDQASIGMATLTLSGTVVRANEALVDLLELPEEEIIGTPIESFFFSEDRPELLEAMRRTAEEPRAHKSEHRLRRQAQRRWVHSTVAAVRDTEERPLYLFAQLEDVTARHEALEQLQASEERFRLMVESVQDYAIFMLDRDGFVTTWNLGAQRLKGYTAEEIIGLHFGAFYPSEARQRLHPQYELEVAVREGRYQEEGWRVRKDGTEFWANVVITALFDRDGNHLGFAKVTRDMSETRSAVERLRASEERFRLMVELVQDYAIFMLDRDGHVSTWNLGAQRLKGYTAEEIIGQHFRVFYPPEVVDRGHPEFELEVALRDGRYEEEGWRVRKDGTLFWANVVITALFDDAGDHLGFAKVTRDMSERRYVEQARDEFLSLIAHELQSPVATINGASDILVEYWQELDEAERLDTLQRIAAGGDRIRRLLDDLLTASRLEAGTFTIAAEELRVDEVVADALRELGEIETPVELEGLEGLVVFADPARVIQILTNLLTNAMKYGVPPFVVEGKRVGDMVEVRVRDHGTGAAPELRDRLFDKFAKTLTTKVRGTGLGLYIVRELARMQGGDAWYEPTPAFVVSLPAIDR